MGIPTHNSQSESDEGKNVEGDLPQTYLSVLDVEKERVIAVSLRETAITCDFF